jgi:ribonuclease G
MEHKNQEIAIETRPWQTSVAVLENGKLVELLTDSASDYFIPGNIYKGKIVKVIPSMQAVFVDIGARRTGYMFIRSRSDIHKFKHGDNILVQIQKGASGSKGAKLTDKPTVPGKYTVLTLEGKIGVSRKIRNPAERRRLAKIMKALRSNVNEGTGVVARTEAQGVDEKPIKDDFEKLVNTFKEIKSRYETEKAPALLWSNQDVLKIAVRELASKNLKRIITDDEETFSRIKALVKEYMPSNVKIDMWRRTEPLFRHLAIDREIEKALQSTVMLQTGATMRFQELEAFCAIDVNTASFMGRKDLEHTALNTNLDAASEIARQIRLRRIGGILIVDFIDMLEAENKEKLIKHFKRELRKDRLRAKMFGISKLGLLELTRKRERESLLHSLTDECKVCGGTGRVQKAEFIMMEVLEKIREKTLTSHVKVKVNPKIARLLSETPYVKDMELKTKKIIKISEDESLPMPEFYIERLR